MGAVIIIILILYALIAPLCSPYTVNDTDTNLKALLPRNGWFVNTSFWDGCSEEDLNEFNFTKYYAMGAETGHNAIKNQEYTVYTSNAGTTLYNVRLDSYHAVGMKYITATTAEYLAIQQYQNDTGIQVIYPTIHLDDRPTATLNSTDANFYYQTSGTTTTKIVYSDSSDPTSVIPVYYAYSLDDGVTYDNTYSEDIYDSIRIEGDAYEENGYTYYYSYARNVQGDYYELRINYYEYYIYYHSQVLGDNLGAPSFLFGTTGKGQDIFAVLAYAARFSLLFSTAVAVVNLLFGAIYGAIEGYYGGKRDLIMERISDILSAVPFYVVITLLKLYMSSMSSSAILILFFAFFATGWIGMASTTRMQFYRYKNQEYVLAARTMGARDGRIIRKHIFPNALGTLVTSCALVIPSMIYTEVSLSYLGVLSLSSGNLASVGVLLSDAYGYISSAPHMVMFPAAFLALLMLSFNLFGNGLRDAFNPMLRGSED